MAGEDEGLEEKTEEASQHKREEWKKEGRVSQSKELNGALVLFGLSIVLYMSAQWSFGGLYWLMEGTLGDLGKVATEDWSYQKVVGIFAYAFKAFGYVIAPVGIAAMVIGVVGSIMQTGFVWSVKPLEMDIAKLDPVKGFQKLVGPEGFFEFLKAIIKFGAVGGVLWFMLADWLSKAPGFWQLEPVEAAAVIGPKIFMTIAAVSLAMLLMAGIDFTFQRFRFEQKIKMSRQELKEERKDVEGDPQIKARVRAIQRQISQKRMLEEVASADVVVTNPTHIAVALKYDRDAMMAPKVVAKGADFMAEKIKKIAREAGVPCVENVALARAMFKALKLGQFVSKELYNAVAEVLAYVYRLRGRANA